MQVKIILKDYGPGKERLILVNESDGNRAFKSFGRKDSEWDYLFEQYKKTDESSNETLKKLQHYKDSTVGLWALDRDPKKLLTDFWQRSSDACPLEASESEKQEAEFESFVDTLCFQLD